MNAIEKHYRLVTIAERIEQLDRDLALIPMRAGTSEQDDVLSAIWHLQRAVQKLQAQPSPREQKQNLTALLQRSIDERMEKKRCAEIGQESISNGESALSPAGPQILETEKARRANVEPFPKPSTAL